MTTCHHCRQEMANAVSCIPDRCAGDTHDRVPNGDEPCHDCATPAHGFHHPGCAVERCPACGGQAISCGCNEADK